jgi:hypothetical protein
LSDHCLAAQCVVRTCDAGSSVVFDDVLGRDRWTARKKSRWN